jgi:signal transduction histidine kinase
VILDQEGRPLIASPGMPDALTDGAVLAAAEDEGLVRDEVGGALLLSHPVEGYPWRVLVAQPLSAVDQLAFRFAARSFLVVLVLGAIVLAAVYAVSRQLTRPLRQMARAAESIARGNLDLSVPGGGEDEIGRLAQSFENMRRSLQSRQKEMDVLLRIGQQAASSFNLDQVIPPILRAIADLTPADTMRVVIREEALTGQDHRTFSLGADPGNWQALDLEILSLAVSRGQFLLENPTRARAVLNMEELRTPLETLMAVPISHEQQTKGAIWVGYEAPHLFGENEIRLLNIVAGYLGVAVANAALFAKAESERMQLLAVLQATPNAVLLADDQGRLSLVNPAAAPLLKLPPGQAAGKPVRDAVKVEALAGLLSGPRGEYPTQEIPVGPERTYFASVSSVNSPEGVEIGRVCVLWDVTDFKKLDALKSEFVATASHDLRNPITMIRGYATMLQMVGSLNERQKEYVEKIIKAAGEMMGLIDNLLDLGRIEAGLGLQLEPLAIEPVLDGALQAVRPEALRKDIELSVEMGDELRPVQGDGTLIRQALLNLLDNALKFTPNGGKVKVRVGVQGEWLRIAISDSGPGIAPMDQARIFEKFRSASRDGGGQGIGLGLAIVRSIAEQHGGRVSVESRLGEGSTFYLELPLAHDPLTYQGPDV